MMIDIKQQGSFGSLVNLWDDRTDELKCVIKVEAISLITRTVYIQFELFDTLTRADLRWMKRHFKYLARNVNLLCNVWVTDPVALRFAEFFGMEITETLEGRHIMKREL